MKPEELEAALRELDHLAREEYHASLPEVVTRSGDNDEARLVRVGRLIGVMLKQPFATPRDLSEPKREGRAHSSGPTPRRGSSSRAQAH
jgi:hypothetical protein